MGIMEKNMETTIMGYIGYRNMVTGLPRHEEEEEDDLEEGGSSGAVHAIIVLPLIATSILNINGNGNNRNTCNSCDWRTTRRTNLS